MAGITRSVRWSATTAPGTPLALAVGAGWLAKILLVDAIVSPTGTGVVYVGTTARLSYALGEEREMPSALARTNKKGAPVVSILVGALVGCLGFGPFKSWNALVNVVSGATAIMYGFAPISLAALHKLDPDRPRPYRVPAPKIVLPVAFVSANLIIYWGSFPTTWKLALAMAVGLVLFAIGAVVKKTGAKKLARHSAWIAPWLLGHLAIGAIGRYGGIADALRLDSSGKMIVGEPLLPEWVDNAAVIVFSVLTYRLALRLALSKKAAASQIARDADQLDFEAS